jgi:hypothetical protein
MPDKRSVLIWAADGPAIIEMTEEEHAAFWHGVDKEACEILAPTLQSRANESD